MTDSLLAQLEGIVPSAVIGQVARLEGLAMALADLAAPVGSLVQILRRTGEPVLAEVVGFRDEFTLAYPFQDAMGVRRGDRARLYKTAPWVPVGEAILGRVVNAWGVPIDGRPRAICTERVNPRAPAPPAVERPRIVEPLATGIRSIDGLLTCGRGQRMGIFAGSGVGKSVLVGMMSRYTAADVTVIGLIGERGREVNEFLERDLGPQGLARSVVVVATSDESPLLRVRAALTATAIAEYFRDRGRAVLLVMDSLTRCATAQREIGLAAGEPPATRGYPPSVFALLPRLVERAGRTVQGSITGFYTVLVEGDDPNEPISDAVRGLLDGHAWLSRSLASRGHYPAVDVLASISRLMDDVVPPEHAQAALTVRQLLAAYQQHEDLISIGAYRRGTLRQVDLAIDFRDAIALYLRQGRQERVTLEEARESLLALHRAVMAKSTATNSGTGT